MWGGGGVAQPELQNIAKTENGAQYALTKHLNQKMHAF